MSTRLWAVAGALLFACSPGQPAQLRRPAASPASSLPSVASGAPATPQAPPAAPALTLASARHVLERCAFGPRPGESAALAQRGFASWLDEQLADGEPTPNSELEAALLPYRDALAPPSALVESWLGDDWAEDVKQGPGLNQRIQPYFEDTLRKLALAEVVRHVLSPRQLEEVMLDFWANHFNIFARKELVRVFAGDYIERTLRPRALGRFEDLLIATARHPAMLIYLDNERSSAARAHDADPNAKPSGLNENYARELLELHTLGVDGGYTQNDVTEVARVLTGWSVQRPSPLEFVFKKGKHDTREKSVLGQTFPAGHGEDEGLRLLKLLAAHPSTARHLAAKLCARLVADEPPKSCVDGAAAAYINSGGEIRQVLRAIFADESFFSAAYRGNKLKSPLEFVASALRAVGGKPDRTTDLSRALKRLGEPILEESVPTGYPDAEPEWASSEGLLTRMSFATSLGLGRVAGVEVKLDAILPNAGAEHLAEQANRILLDGEASERTLAAVAHALAEVQNPEKRRGLVVALLLGSPEFQRQ